jgi:hypothetical protein
MNPTQPLTAARTAALADDPTLEGLLSSQLKLAQTLQERLNRQDGDELSARDYRDFVSSATSIIGLAHRTEEALKEIRTLRTFIEVVLEFMKERSDTLGEDLVAQLIETSRALRSEQDVLKVLDRRPS